MTGPRLTADAFQNFLDTTAGEKKGRVTTVTPLAGGYSRDTAIAEVEWAGGEAEKFVLRGDPPPAVFMSDRAAEWRLLEALSTTSGPLTIPTPRWFDSTGEHFGAPCIISEFRNGRSLQDLARENEEDLREVRATFVDAVAVLHQTPLDDLPAELARPRDYDEYIDGLIDMVDRYSRSGRDARPSLRYAAGRLRSYRPPAVPLTLVHGDCQPSNFLIGESDVWVIDWEFGRIGDPREDIGNYSHIPVPPNLYEDDPDDFLDRYRRRAGLTEEQLNPDVVEYFYLLGLIRLYGQMMDAADAVADGERRGVMATYLINGVVLQYRSYVDIAKRLADRAAMVAGGASA